MNDISMNGVVMSQSYQIKNPTPELNKELESNEYTVIKLSSGMYVDFSESPEFWNSKDSLGKDIVQTIGTSKHEIGHREDELLTTKILKTKNKKITEEIILGRLFEMTSNKWSGGHGNDNTRNYLEYMLRGSELFRKEAGAYMKIQLGKELNVTKGAK